MSYLICKTCSHTQDCPKDGPGLAKHWWGRCYSCGCMRIFDVVRQIEQPDGSVIEVRA